MVIYTAKLTKMKLVLLVGGAFLFILLVIAAVAALRGNAVDAAASAGKNQPSFKNIRSNDDRVAFLNAYGWEVDKEAVAIEEVVIPREFDDVYSQYNEIQKFQGLDLEKYRGKTVRRYTYEILNYPTGEAQVQANLLVYKNQIVAGDVCSARMEGFMHGLERLNY